MGLCLAAGAMLGLFVATGLAQPAVAQSSLRAAVEGRYEVLPLRDGILLRALDDTAAVQTIELTDSSVFLDGAETDRDELESRLGDEAEWVVELAELSSSDRRALFGFDARPEEELDELVEQIQDEAEELSRLAEERAALEAERIERLRERVERRVRRARESTDAKVALGSSVTLEADEVAEEIVTIGGSIRIDGEVLGDAAAIGGSVTVNGTVNGEVVAVGGSVDLGPDAEVLGDVTSVGGTVNRDPDATVMGRISEVAFSPTFNLEWLQALTAFSEGWQGPWFRRGWHEPWYRFHFGEAMEIGWSLMGIVVLLLLASLILLLGRGTVEKVEQIVLEDFWKAGLIGLAVELLFLPLLIVVVVILCISIIGIPLLVLIPFALLALFVAALVGYTAVAYRLGNWARGRFGWKLDNPYVVLLCGVGLIQVWTLLGDLLDLGGGPLIFFSVMLALFGFLVKYLAWTVGLGAVLLIRFRPAPVPGAEVVPAALPPTPEPPGGVTPPAAPVDLPPETNEGGGQPSSGGSEAESSNKP